jgi:hypothetical protein
MSLHSREPSGSDDLPVVDFLDGFASNVGASWRGISLVTVLQLFEFLLEVNLRDILAEVGLYVLLPSGNTRKRTPKVAPSGLNLAEQLNEFTRSAISTRSVRLGTLGLEPLIAVRHHQ